MFQRKIKNSLCRKLPAAAIPLYRDVEKCGGAESHNNRSQSCQHDWERIHFAEMKDVSR
jgi:hypothetical protein